MKLKVKDACFCFIPAMVGILMIFIVLATFNDNSGIYNEIGWIFFWIFLGLVLIAYSLVSFYTLCKK